MKYTAYCDLHDIKLLKNQYCEKCGFHLDMQSICLKYDFLEDVKKKMKKFFENATDEEFYQALEAAGYERYTGINPRTLVLKPRIKDK
jgi:hypothetical protein